MVYSNQWKVPCVSNGFCLGNSYEKCSYKSRTVCHANSVYIIQRAIRFTQRFFDHLIDLLNMFPGGNFRHHPSVQLVQVNLGRNNIRKNGSSITYNRRRCFVTGTFYCQYCNFFLFTHLSTSTMLPETPDSRSSGLSRL